jgi:hypothetical protein
MQVQVDIGFEQLVTIAKKLPKTQWQKLKAEVEKESPSEIANSDFREFLLNGPTFTKEQIKVIENTRKAVNKWRKI